MADYGFLHPWFMIITIPLIIALFFILRTDFVKRQKIEESPNKVRSRRKLQIFIFIIRSLAILAVMVALASPFFEIVHEVDGDPEVTIVVDESHSMLLYDTSFVPNLITNIQQQLPVSLKSIGAGDESQIGDGVLENLKRETNILLISDGQANSGVSLLDVFTYGAGLNATISTLILEETEVDAAVHIRGPGKVIEDVEEDFIIRIDNVGIEEYYLRVSIDGQNIIDRKDTRKEIPFSHTFKTGTHEIVAELTTPDFNPENNKFYKSVTVVKKPKVLFVGKSSGITEAYSTLYDITFQAEAPTSLDQLAPYFAVVLNDVHIDKLNPAVDVFREYLLQGNGIVVIGGYNSFDRGGYKNSHFETLLPVYTSGTQRKKGDSNIVFAIDISGGQGAIYSGGGGGQVVKEVLDPETGKMRKIYSFDKGNQQLVSEGAIDTAKAKAVSAIETLNSGNRVGAIAFNWAGVYKIQDISPLKTTREGLMDKVSRLETGSSTALAQGIEGAYQLLADVKGDKHIIFISDGKSNPADKQLFQEKAKAIARKGVNIHVVGLGHNINEQMLQWTAEIGNGIYDNSGSLRRLIIQFGDPEEKDFGKPFQLIVMNDNDFITKNLDEPTATLFGFNQVVPRDNAKMLIASDGGSPAVTSWWYGLGRVTTLNVFASEQGLGELLNEANSELLSRLGNWAIGDPERKEKFDITIGDARINKQTSAIIRSESYPSIPGMDILATEEGLYRGTFTPTQLGFNSILTETFGVNYPKEYQNIGIAEDLPGYVGAYGGNIFKHTEVDNIIEFVKSASKKTIREKKVYQWPFLLMASLLFLLEVLVRRIKEYWLRK